MVVPGTTRCTHVANAEWRTSDGAVIVVCFDQRTDYVVARIGARPAFALTPAVVRDAILDLESYRAHVEVIVDHDDLVGAGYAGEPEFVRQVRPLIFSRLLKFVSSAVSASRNCLIFVQIGAVLLKN
jgi:hypothetical protein